MKWILIALLLTTMATAACIEPMDGSTITESVIFCSDTYDLPSGITIIGDNIEVDCGTAILRGNVGESEIGIRIEHATNITLKNCNVLTYNQALYMKNVTNSLIEDNAFLKNRIGIRMLDSYENIIRDNNDKSHELAVSAITSKFNIVMLGNKNIERDFCEVNACNEFRDMNPCEDNDFYCSVKCSAETDKDCKAPARVVLEEVESAEDIVERIEKEVREEFSPQATEMTIVEKRGISWETQALVYILAYVFVFFVIQVMYLNQISS